MFFVHVISKSIQLGCFLFVLSIIVSTTISLSVSITKESPVFSIIDYTTISFSISMTLEMHSSSMLLGMICLKASSLNGFFSIYLVIVFTSEIFVDCLFQSFIFN